ncbi:MAG: hypothetical protein GY806_08870 [Gammaproteobacteria bacterium]|nr:hypothetical protein [Gammaproteobacteria bacterium]
MTNAAISNIARFNALSLRERLLLAVVVVVVLIFGWWHLHAQPTMTVIDAQKADNERVSREVSASIVAVNEIRQRIADGVHREKQQRLLQLKAKLQQIEEDLKLKTIELIDPEDMFSLMSRMIYRESGLKLLNLQRLEVRPAITPAKGEEDKDPGIYRHVLEVKFSGSYSDILGYIEKLESIDQKLIWDEIEIVSIEHPDITVKLNISTLSTREEWVGV